MAERLPSRIGFIIFKNVTNLITLFTIATKYIFCDLIVIDKNKLIRVTRGTVWYNNNNNNMRLFRN